MTYSGKVLFLCFVLLGAFQTAWAQDHGPHTTIADNIDTVIKLIDKPLVKLKDVNDLAQKDDIKGAEALLSQRIDSIKELLEKGIMVSDGDPDAVDCLTLRYFFRIYLDDINGAKDDINYQIEKIQFAESRMSLDRLDFYVSNKKEEPAKFLNFVKMLSQSLTDFIEEGKKKK